MKKLVLLLTAALAFSGLVAASGSAFADQYPGTVKTHSVPSVAAVYSSHNPIKVGFKSSNGSVNGKGRLVIVVKNADGNVVKTYFVTYKGGKQTFKLRKLKPGKYTIVFKLNPKNPTLKNSTVKDHFKVQRHVKKHH